MAYSSSILNASALETVCRGALSRSLSAEDVRKPDDNIQMYLATGSSDARKQFVVSSKIAAVNLRLKSPQRGFYTRNSSVFLGSKSSDDLEKDGSLVSANTMHFVLGLSELLNISVTTCDGKEFGFSLEKALQPRVADVKRRICEEEDSLSAKDLQLVLAGVPLQDNIPIDDLDEQGSCHLHLVIDRKAKVRASAGSQRGTMELTVCSCEAASKLPSLATVLEEEQSPWAAKLPAMRLAWKSDVPTEKASPLQHASFMQAADGKPESLSRVDQMMASVRRGLENGLAPKLTSDGSGGTYLMSDETGDAIAAVFKPMDEEPLAANCPRGMEPSETGEGLKKGTRVGEGAFREVAAFLLDHPETAGSLEGFAGVPATTMVRCKTDLIPKAGSSPDSVLRGLEALEAAKVGSLQEFVDAVSNCEDMGPSRFATSEVHKIAVLDMRLANADRNGANILVKKNELEDGREELKLVPIDHGYCMPESFADCTFEWLYWPQAKQPFDSRTLNYIAKLDPLADVATLAAHGWRLSRPCLAVFLAATLLLQCGAAAGMTPHAIGSLMTRSSFDLPSPMETLVEAFLGKVDAEEKRFGSPPPELKGEGAADGTGLQSSPAMFAELLSRAVRELVRAHAPAGAAVAATGAFAVMA